MIMAKTTCSVNILLCFLVTLLSMKGNTFYADSKSFLNKFYSEALWLLTDLGAKQLWLAKYMLVSTGGMDITRCLRATMALSLAL